MEENHSWPKEFLQQIVCVSAKRRDVLNKIYLLFSFTGFLQFKYNNNKFWQSKILWLNVVSHKHKLTVKWWWWWFHYLQAVINVEKIVFSPSLRGTLLICKICQVKYLSLVYGGCCIYIASSILLCTYI